MKKSLTESFHTYLNTLAPGARLPSERALAKQFSVGRTAVNHLVTNLIGQGILQRTGYQLKLKSPPAESPTRCISVILPESRFAAGIKPVLQSFDLPYTLQVCANSNRIRHALLELVSHPPQGVLLWSSGHDDLTDTLESSGCPVIRCGPSSYQEAHVTSDISRIPSRAIEYLRRLGHREILLVHPDKGHTEQYYLNIILESYQQYCNEQKMKRSASRILMLQRLANFKQQVDRFLGAKHRPTAILCYNVHLSCLLIEHCQRRHLRIPEDISLVCLMNKPQTHKTLPTLTTADIDPAEVGKLGCYLLREAVMQHKLTLNSYHHSRVMCLPALTVRQSTGKAPPQGLPVRICKPRLQHASRWPDDRTERQQQVQAINRRVFADLPSRLETDFFPLDLTAYLNRPFTPRCAWLGALPLKHFSAGTRSLHEVPFSITCNPQQNTCLVLRSAKARTRYGRALTSQVVIPVRRHCRRVYLLHAAGWISSHDEFARYEFQFTDQIVPLPVIPYFTGPPKSIKKAQWQAQASLQDWYSLHPSFHSDHTLPVLVTDDQDPLLYEAYLYVHQWINPFPDQKLESITIRSLNPDAPASLGVIGITLEA